MKKERLKGFILGMVAGIVAFLAVIVVTKYFGIHIFPSGSLADDVWERAKVVEGYIDHYYWKDDTSDKKISEYAAKGMVNALGDKYSAYFTSEEYEETMSSVNGDYAGIGATVRIDAKTKQKIIAEVQKGRPAEKAGLKAGDEIKKVNGKDVSDMSLSDTVGMIKGKEGKKSVLSISRMENGVTVSKDITVVCEKIVNQSIQSKMLADSIGYIKISVFDNESVKQFQDAIAGLEKKGQKGMIIDVRDNGGGSLSAVVDMLDELLPKGKLITEKSKYKGEAVYESTDEKHFDKPIVVLINGSSASASEVFAGTLQDRGKATLVGVKSYGKGIVQTIFSLESSCGGGIKLTTGEYLLPSGRSIHEVGLTPDVEEKYTGDADNYNEKDDNQLSKAVEVLKNSESTK